MKIESKFNAGDKVFVAYESENIVRIYGPVAICKVSIEGTAEGTKVFTSIKYHVNQLNATYKESCVFGSFADAAAFHAQKLGVEKLAA